MLPLAPTMSADATTARERIRGSEPSGAVLFGDPDEQEEGCGHTDLRRRQCDRRPPPAMTVGRCRVRDRSMSFGLHV